MTLTRDRLETIAIATGEFDTMSHEDIQEIARLAIKAIDMQWRPIEEAPRDGGKIFVYRAMKDYPGTTYAWPCRWSDSGWTVETLFLENPPTHFIPLSALGKPEE